MHNHTRYLLVDTQRRKRLIQSKAMHMMAGFFIVFYGTQHISAAQEFSFHSWTIALMGLSLIILPLAKKKFFEDMNIIRSFRILEAGFLGMGSMFYLQQNKNGIAILFMFLAIVILALLWFELRLFSDRYIHIDHEGAHIEHPLRTKLIPQSDIEQIVLNHNILAISTHNGKIYQYDVQKINDN